MQFGKYLSCPPGVIATDRELALMNSIKVVFPTTKNLICIWHISKNILANCRKIFISEKDWEDFINDWNSFCESKTLEASEYNWNIIKTKYPAKYPSVVDYVEKTWIVRKEQFVRCYTDQYLHLGSRSTSRGEGSHFVIKRYINLARCDLLQVFTKLNHLLENQFCELNQHIEDEKLKIMHQHRIPLFEPILQNISRYSLNLLLEQYHLSLKAEESSCSGCFTNSYGLPCQHLLKNYIRQSKVQIISNYLIFILNGIYTFPLQSSIVMLGQTITFLQKLKF